MTAAHAGLDGASTPLSLELLVLAAALAVGKLSLQAPPSPSDAGTRVFELQPDHCDNFPAGRLQRLLEERRVQGDVLRKERMRRGPAA